MKSETTNIIRVRRILDKLEQVRTRELSCYGSDAHGFRLNPPLAEAELRALESEHGISLPEDYRTFLLHAGNGGAGPYNGLYPATEWNDFADWVVDGRPENFMGLPCPLYKGMPRTPNWYEHFKDVSPYQGTLSLGSRGCAYATQLIVSGPYAGRVVYVDADDNEPPYIVHEPDFLAWYERWLDERLMDYTDGWFGYGPGGGEDDFWRILDDPQADDEFKAEAANAFRRLPHLSDATAERVPKLLHSPLAGVRSEALGMVGKFELRIHTELAGRLLEDPSAEVRQMAIYTALKLDAPRWAEAVRHLLHEDSNEDVVRKAFSDLETAGVLTKADVLRVSKASPESPQGRLRAWAVGDFAWEDEDAPLLIRLLADEIEAVRFSAVRALRCLNNRDALPYVLELLSRETSVHFVGAILSMLGDLAEPSTVPVLLKWAECADDFHRLAAFDALVMIGDERAVPIARALLQIEHPPSRKDARSSMTHVKTTRELVQASLENSPNPILRDLKP